MEFVFSLTGIDEAARNILSELKYPVTVFNGEMGAGKTTLIKALCRELDIFDTTSSPTFSIVNEYRTASGEPVYHFDVYRLKDESEALDMGIEEYLHSGHRCFIEWAQKIPGLLPDLHHVIEISELSDGSRRVFLQ